MNDVDLRGMRRRAGLSQDDLARASGVDQGTISEIERGKRVPRPSTLRKLARGLGVKVAEVFDALGPAARR